MQIIQRIFKFKSKAEEEEEKRHLEAQDAIRFALLKCQIRNVFNLGRDDSSPFFYSHLNHLYGKRWHDRVVYDPVEWSQAELRTELLHQSCEQLLSFINFPDRFGPHTYQEIQTARDIFAYSLLQYFFQRPDGNILDLDITDFQPKSLEASKQREEVLNSFGIALIDDQRLVGIEQPVINEFVLDAIFHDVRKLAESPDKDELTQKALSIEIDRRYQEAFLRLNSLSSSELG